MTRHITDTGHERADGPRLREFLRVEKRAQHHDATKTLHKVPRGPHSARQTEEYLRIERGRTT